MFSNRYEKSERQREFSALLKNSCLSPSRAFFDWHKITVGSLSFLNQCFSIKVPLYLSLIQVFWRVFWKPAQLLIRSGRLKQVDFALSSVGEGFCHLSWLMLWKHHAIRVADNAAILGFNIASLASTFSWYITSCPNSLRISHLNMCCKDKIIIRFIDKNY